MAKTRYRFARTRKWLVSVFIVLGLLVRPEVTLPQTALAYRFLIPEGYVGWIRIDFGISGTAPLPMQDGFYVFKISETGRFQTSSRDLLDSRRNEFFYYSGDTKYRLRQGGPREQRLVQVEFSGPGIGHRDPVPSRYRYIFIGPSDVFNKYQAADRSKDPTENDGYPKAGAQYWLTRDDLVAMKVRQPD